MANNPSQRPELPAENFIGGRGFVAKMLYDEIPSGTRAFDPENMLIAATGLLTGKAESPSYLAINDDTVEIRPAADYWGQGSMTRRKI